MNWIRPETVTQILPIVLRYCCLLHINCPTGSIAQISVFPSFAILFYTTLHKLWLSSVFLTDVMPSHPITFCFILSYSNTSYY